MIKNDIFQAFNSASRYLGDLLNIGNPYFEGIVGQMYPPELQLNKANASDTKALLLNLPDLFQTDLFHPKLLISVMILILA